MNRKKELSRITIDIPKEDHKKLKAMAAILGKCMREIVIESLKEQLNGSKIPNKKTLKVIADAHKGKGLTTAKDAEDLFEKLGL